MILYDVEVTKLGKFLLPSLDKTLLETFEYGLMSVCKEIDGNLFYEDPNNKSTKLLNIFIGIEDDDIDSLKTLFLLIYNTYKLKSQADSNAIDFINDLILYLDATSYSIEHVYSFMIEKYYTEYYATQFQYYVDMKSKNIKGTDSDIYFNIIAFPLNVDIIHYFTGENIEENDYKELTEKYLLVPNISYIKKNNTYRNYREAEEDYLNIMKNSLIPSADCIDKIKFDKIKNKVKFDSKTNIATYDFPFLKLYEYKHDFLKDTELNEMFAMILGGWYKRITTNDYYNFLYDFVDYLFTKSTLNIPDIKFQETFTSNNLKMFYASLGELDTNSILNYKQVHYGQILKLFKDKIFTDMDFDWDINNLDPDQPSLIDNLEDTRTGLINIFNILKINLHVKE